MSDFLELSKFMLGIPFQPPLPPITDLDPSLAQTYYMRLVCPPNPPQSATQMQQLLEAWRQIAAQPSDQWPALFKSQIQSNASLWPMAQQIIMAWYTGVCGMAPRTADLYERTLVWVLAQAHPMGVPLAFGYWQYAPQGATP